VCELRERERRREKERERREKFIKEKGEETGRGRKKN
jgi:hypothetical protein